MSTMLLFRKAEHIVGDRVALEIIHLGIWVALGIIWIGAALALWSLANYMKNVWAYFR